MRIRQAILEALEPRCQGVEVRDVRIGLGYTAVHLEDGRTGVAYTFGREGMHGCSAFSGDAPLVGRPAAELLRFLESKALLEVVLALATANALANVRSSSGIVGDVLDAITLSPTDKVGMIGYFGPLVPVLEKKVAQLEVFEEHGEFAGAARPASEAYKALPLCDVALITSTTIINNTLDRLLESATKCRETVLLGSSTPLLPEAFTGTPVTVLSGITIEDAPGMLRLVSERGGTRSFKRFATKWNLRLREV